MTNNCPQFSFPVISLQWTIRFFIFFHFIIFTLSDAERCIARTAVEVEEEEEEEEEEVEVAHKVEAEPLSTFAMLLCIN